jgi:hypothetical protein
VIHQIQKGTGVITKWRWTTVPKYKESFFKPTFDFNRDLFEGLVWQEPNSKGDGHYAVELHPKGFQCECPGFTFRGKCNHSQIVNDRIKEAVDGEVPEYYTY